MFGGVDARDHADMTGPDGDEARNMSIRTIGLITSLLGGAACLVVVMALGPNLSITRKFVALVALVFVGALLQTYADFAGRQGQ